MGGVKAAEKVAGSAPSVDGLGGIADGDQLSLLLGFEHSGDARVGVLGFVVEDYVPARQLGFAQLPLFEVHVMAGFESASWSSSQVLPRPLRLGQNGKRMDRHGAARVVRRVARRAGIDKPIGPHTLRHAFITAALDAGVPLRDVQEAASHADPRTTMRYDRARVSLDRHATYIVATFVAGASR